MKNILITLLTFIFILSLAFYQYNKTIREIEQKHQEELLILNKKHKVILERYENEKLKLEQLYKQREKIDKGYKEKQDKLLDDIDRLEAIIKKKPEIVTKKMESSLKSFMREVYEETNSTNR